MDGRLIPSGERRRLRALDRTGAMDAPADKFTDAVAAAAATIVGAPMGAVSLVGKDLMRLKSSCGLPSVDVSRRDAFCSHTIMGAVPFIVPDLLRDDRFASNPLVMGAPRARFYAGFPLIVDGSAIGAVCVIDDRPRTLSDEQIRRLVQLAEGTAAWLALRRSSPEAVE